MMKYGLLLVALAVGCSGDKSPPGPDRDALAQTIAKNRAMWAESGSQNYRFNFQRTCFCLPEYTREAVLDVADRAIIAATYADDGIAVKDDLDDRYATVDELFALLEEAVAIGAVQIDVVFDAELGYLTSFFIDYDQGIADDEQWIAVSKLLLSP